MKKFFRLCVILAALLALFGCVRVINWLIPSEEHSPYYIGNRYDLFRVALNSFPGPRQGRGTKIDETLIETDEYGRELFIIKLFQAGEYYQGDILAEVDEVNSAYVVCQAHDDTKVYYYEDLCFKLFNDKIGIEPNLLKELKTENDWNQPLAPEKCSSRLYASDFAGMSNLSFDYDAQMCIEDLFDGKCFISPITEDASGKQLYGVRVKNDDQNMCYLVIYHPGKAIEMESDVLKLESIDFGKELHKLKIHNGWNFTDCPGDSTQD
jgi:hypothetical protein